LEEFNNILVSEIENIHQFNVSAGVTSLHNHGDSHGDKPFGKYKKMILAENFKTSGSVFLKLRFIFLFLTSSFN